MISQGFKDFSNGYISIHTIFKCCYIIFSWGRGHQLSMYTTGGGIGGSFKMRTAVYRGRGLSCLMCRYALTLFLLMFLAAFLSERVNFLQQNQFLSLWNKLFLGCLIGMHIKERKRQRRGGGTDEQTLFDKPPLIWCGETYST